MHTTEEILWPKFKTLNEIRNLPLQEQIKRYNKYLDELSKSKYNDWYNPRGGDEPIKEVYKGFLQQENFFYILQENGSKIYIT